VALNAYVTQVQRLLHDASAQFWSVSELTDYINEARKRVVRDTGGNRVLQTIYLSTGVEVYPFGGVTGFNVTAGGTGYGANSTVTVAASGATGGVTATANPTITNGVITSIQVVNPGTLYTSTPAVTITPVGGGSGAAATAYFLNAGTFDCVNLTVYWGNSRAVLSSKPWSVFNAQGRAWVQYLGLPTWVSVYNYTQLYVAKIPDQTYQCDADTILLPVPLVVDSDLEVIPPVLQDPIQYFAAYLAKVKSQKWGEADAFYQRYDREILKAINSSYTRRIAAPYFNR
jgi:hypothetical protein